MGALPTSICFGSDITTADFETHSACWHKSCRLKYNNGKLARAKKRVISRVEDCERSRPIKRQAMNISNCLFCEKGQEDGDLHLVSTFDADANIRARTKFSHGSPSNINQHTLSEPHAKFGAFIRLVTVISKAT